MNNILVTDFTDKDMSGDPEDVMVFTTLSADQIKAKLKLAGCGFEDIYAVPNREVQFYVYEACHLTREDDDKIRGLLKKAAAA
ncbi:MAG: hypothetical protein NXI32_05100 [bacterium]|nr:hypothetical protein [bacterium]